MGKEFYFMPLTKVMLDIRNWIKNIEQHASDNVNKILVGNKADMDESKRVKNSFFACKMFSITQFVYLMNLLLFTSFFSFRQLQLHKVKHWRMSTN